MAHCVWVDFTYAEDDSLCWKENLHRDQAINVDGLERCSYAGVSAVYVQTLTWTEAVDAQASLCMYEVIQFLRWIIVP